MENKKSYYAIIPANVRYAKIPDKAKLLYGEITALCNEKGYCWASNNYFAQLYDVHKNTISRLISILAKNEFIEIELIKKDGKEVLRKMFIGIRKNEVGYTQNCLGGIRKNAEENITMNNTTKHISIKDTNTHECGDVDLFGERKVSKVKKEPDPIIDGVLHWFEKTYGFMPTDHKPRFVAFNLIRSATSMYKRVKGTNVVDKAELGQMMVSFLKWYSKQKGYDNTQRLETVRSKLPVYEAEAKGLRK